MVSREPALSGAEGNQAAPFDKLMVSLSNPLMVGLSNHAPFDKLRVSGFSAAC